MEISAIAYLKRLKLFKSYIRNYKKIMRDDWPGYLDDVWQHVGVGRNVLGMLSMTFNKTITVFNDHNKPRGKFALGEIDRMIIGQNLALVIDTGTGNVKVCHAIDSKTHPYMPLNEYIKYLERGIGEGSIKRSDKYHFRTTGPTHMPLLEICTVISDEMEYPIAYRTLVTDDLKDYGKPISATLAFHYLEIIDEFLETETPRKERRKKHGRSTKSDHQSSAR